MLAHDWKLVTVLMSKLASIIEETNYIYTVRVGMYGKRFAIKHIQQQDLKWAPLDKTYQRFKMRYKKDKKYVLTNSYRSAITNFTTRNLKGHYAHIGIPKGYKPQNRVVGSSGKGKSRLYRLNFHHPRYVHFLEYGRSGAGQVQPARPLWRPLLREMRDFINNDKQYYYSLLRRKIRSYI